MWPGGRFLGVPLHSCNWENYHLSTKVPVSALKKKKSFWCLHLKNNYEFPTWFSSICYSNKILKVHIFLNLKITYLIIFSDLFSWKSSRWKGEIGKSCIHWVTLQISTKDLGWVAVDQGTLFWFILWVIAIENTRASLCFIPLCINKELDWEWSSCLRPYHPERAWSQKWNSWGSKGCS